MRYEIWIAGGLAWIGSNAVDANESFDCLAHGAENEVLLKCDGEIIRDNQGGPTDDDEGENENENEDDDCEPRDSHDCSDDAAALASAGFGTDEDYGCFDGYDE